MYPATRQQLDRKPEKEPKASSLYFAMILTVYTPDLKKAVAEFVTNVSRRMSKDWPIKAAKIE